MSKWYSTPSAGREGVVASRFFFFCHAHSVNGQGYILPINPSSFMYVLDFSCRFLFRRLDVPFSVWRGCCCGNGLSLLDEPWSEGAFFSGSSFVTACSVERIKIRNTSEGNRSITVAATRGLRNLLLQAEFLVPREGWDRMGNRHGELKYHKCEL